ncbi:selenocysteine-specific translation elongation factor [Rubrobacter tropicus]|uniref:Selenocysteine-specific elongation factor n=1 Tax=Rubrobacter tropicus TaxID=2653851 RepID=A0A6G8QAB5_9ACTN|nr:selenocysteine-specific translation elongation factor [Rubrobacter tropicus]QIN83399.1 selenocysteine-specific translation elongation factor [Rubrobacter tropicus]
MGEPADGRIALTIGTAGHVDHGKTTLVRRMTGTDTDRLEEEHRRGISIVPGYAELVLPGGRRASLVDVPGHERFVKNMVSGATGVDAFLLVVAADDGVMPQTREHLDVLRVLGVERGVVALTKTDAVDEETAELAALDAEDLLESVGISAPVIPASGKTGEGVEELLRALDGLAAQGHEDHVGGRLARLPVDRVFVLKGIGVVATGTLWSGEIRTGDTLYTSRGHRPRVRSIQNHGHPAEVAHPGARTALDLTGIDASQLEAGDVLLSRPIPESRAFDARLRLLEGARPLAHGARVRLHHGTRATNARVRLSGTDGLQPGESAFARLRPEEPLILLPGDRFVLRAMSPQVTIGGGTVLDPAPAGRRPEPGWLEALERGDVSRTIPLVLARYPARGMSAEELALAVSVSPKRAQEVSDGAPEISKVGSVYASAEAVSAAKDRLHQALRSRAKEHPESPEVSVAEARSAMQLESPLADALLEDLAGAEVRVTGTGVSLPGAGEVSAELEEAARRLLAELDASGAEPPAPGPSPELRLLLKRDEAVDLGGGLFASRDTADLILEDIKTVCREEGEISLSGLRDRLGTSRRYAQAWLEFSDASGVTSRTGDVRVLTRRHRGPM